MSFSLLAFVSVSSGYKERGASAAYDAAQRLNSSDGAEATIRLIVVSRCGRAG
jgi:hypothetical protein